MRFFLALVVGVLCCQIDALRLPTAPLRLARRAATGLVLPFLLGQSLPGQSLAFGPVEIPLTVGSYKQVEPLCNGQKITMPGQKAMEGLYPACIEVEASVKNPSDKTLKDVSVYGFVKENVAGNSVLPNNPDFKSDAGQYAMIKAVGPGESQIKFQFVIAIQQDTKKGEALPPLEFMKTKAISFPGGDKFQPLTDCEMDPRSCAEEGEDE